MRPWAVSSLSPTHHTSTDASTDDLHSGAGGVGTAPAAPNTAGKATGGKRATPARRPSLRRPPASAKRDGAGGDKLPTARQGGGRQKDV